MLNYMLTGLCNELFDGLLSGVFSPIIHGKIVLEP